VLTVAWFELALLVTAGAAALEDLAERRISNALLTAALVCAVVLHISGGSVGMMVAGMAAGLVLLPLYLLRGMAAGDIKLLMVLGAFGGPTLALQTAGGGLFVFAAIAIAGIHLGLCVRQQTLPFAPALAAGAVLAVAQVWG
jgi:prepilin peptidase CpaA